MSAVVYMSNYNTRWPFERQQEWLAERFPKFPEGLLVYRDHFSVLTRHGTRELIHKRLVGRRKLLELRPPAHLYVATVSVLSPWKTELREWLPTLQVPVTILDDRWTIAPGQEVHPKLLSERYMVSKHYQSYEEMGLNGAQVTGKRQKEITDRIVETMRPKWSDWDNYPDTEALCKAHRIARNTVISRLGKRPPKPKPDRSASKKLGQPSQTI